MPNTHDRLARGRRLPERREKARSLGRPPEWLEVGPGRAQRLLAFVLDLQGQPLRFGVERMNCYNLLFVPVHPMALRLSGEYLETGKHGGAVSHESLDSTFFRRVANSRTGALKKHLDPGSVYRNIVMKYAEAMDITAEAVGVCVHSMRAKAATNALSNETYIAKVEEWRGHANVSTTRLHDRRKTRPEDSPTFYVKY